MRLADSCCLPGNLAHLRCGLFRLGGGRFSNLPLIQPVGFENGFENPTAHKNLSLCFIGHKPGNSSTLELAGIFIYKYVVYGNKPPEIQPLSR